jgi:RNA-directed DNA polymerase
VEIRVAISLDAKAGRRPTGHSLRDNVENHDMRELQMTVKEKSNTGAPAAKVSKWSDFDWDTIQANVHRLQMRIAKAYREKKYGRAKALQWILTHSYHAKLLAVRRVTINRGAKTPGVDQVTWTTSKQKIQAVNDLKRREYKTLPLRRIYIEKKQKGSLRPLSIPAMQCRAMQALHLLSLEPIAEMMADENAYGFRPKRSVHDAIGQCYLALRLQGSSKYILEADIKSCFDSISKSWLLNNVPVDKTMLKKWLEAGYIENKELFQTENGVPQGGVISPAILVVTLSGLEETVSKTISNNRKDKVHFSTYADDFIITGATKEILENKVKPAVENFLSERGLALSKEKTKITHIDDGFNFLGFNIRKYRNKLIIKPAKSSVNSMLADIKKTVKSNGASKTEDLIHALNSKLRGWSNHYRHVCAKRTFEYMSHRVFKLLWRWATRRHPNKGERWIKQKYFRTTLTRNWVFSSRIKDRDGKAKNIDLFDIGQVKIVRHAKIRANATPYDPNFAEYFQQREDRKKLAIQCKRLPGKLNNLPLSGLSVVR